MTDLLRELQEKNVARCERDFKHRLLDWSALEWAGAMAGEAGEATNFAKKLTRGDFKLDDPMTRKGVTQSARLHLADEVADMVIYADLLCTYAGTSLREALVRKFNATSVERGSTIRLDEIVLGDTQPGDIG